MPERIGPKKPVRVFLAAWREHKNLTQQQVADRLGQGVHKGTVSRWENAKRVPNLNVIAAYAEAIGVALDDLLHPPDRSEALWPLWEKAKSRERRQLVEIAKTILKEAS